MSGDDTNPQQQQRYPCPVCGNTFTRPQHVVRHLRSHTGERPYKCKECGDAFARSDLLSRHVNKCHPALANSGPPQSGKHPKRRACENCAHTGSRCDSNSPCSSCVEQDVSCSRMPKAIGNHHTSTPSYVDPRSGLPSLNSTVPSFSGHRRNISGSDWSSDSSSRSRSSQYSQPGTSGFGFDGTTLDGLSTSRNPPGPSGLPAPWAPGTSGSQLDQSTVTPSQVRAMYGGSLPAGYTHPSQFSSVGGGINLPNPALLPSASGLDSFNSFTLMNYGNTQRSNAGSGTGQSSFGAGGPSHLSLGGWKDYPGQGQQQQQQPQQQQASYGSQPLRSSYDATMPTGAPSTYAYDAMPEFAHHNVQGVPQGAYAVTQHEHQQQLAGSGAESGVNSAPSGGSSYTNSSSSTIGPSTGTTGSNQTRPSLPGLDSFISATFPPADTTGDTMSPSTVTTNPGMAYLYGRGADRRGSVASSGSALSDNVLAPSSMALQPPSPSDGSRPTTSSSGVSYGPLPSTFSGLQLRGGSGGSVPDGSACSSGEAAPGDSRTAGAGGGGGNSGTEVGGANEAERSRLRQIWSSWITTPLSSTTEKDAFIMSNGAPTPLGHPSAGSTGAGSNSGSQTAGNPILAGVPPLMYPSRVPNKQGQNDEMNQQQQQLPSALQKSMSLPVIRTPNLERRMMGDVPTPLVHNNQTYNADDLRRYQQACLARVTPSLTLAPRVRNSHTPGADSNTDEASNSPSPISGGSSGGGSGQSGYVPIGGGDNTFNIPPGNSHAISPTSRSGSSQSGGSCDSYGQRGPNAGATTMWHQFGPPAMSEPDPQVAKLNMNLTGQIGQTYSSQLRPGYKRLASQTLGPELIKRTAVSGRGDDGGGNDRCGDNAGGGNGDVFGYEIPDPPPPIARKRCNSSPTYNSVGFQPLPPFSAGASAATGHGNSALLPPLPPVPHPP